eukprot:UN19819
MFQFRRICPIFAITEISLI